MSGLALLGGRDARIDLSTQDLTIHSPGVLDSELRLPRSRVSAVVCDGREAQRRFRIEPNPDPAASMEGRTWESSYVDQEGRLWLYPGHPPTAIPVVNGNSKLEPNLLIVFEARMPLPAVAPGSGFAGGIVQAFRMRRTPRAPIRHRPVQGVFCAVEDLDAARVAFRTWPLADRVPYRLIEPPPPLPDDPEDLRPGLI